MAGEGRLEPRDPASADHHEGPEHTSPGPSPHLGDREGRETPHDKHPAVRLVRYPLRVPPLDLALLPWHLPEGRTTRRQRRPAAHRKHRMVQGLVRLKPQSCTSRESGRAGSCRRFLPEKEHLDVRETPGREMQPRVMGGAQCPCQKTSHPRTPRHPPPPTTRARLPASQAPRRTPAPPRHRRPQNGTQRRADPQPRRTHPPRRAGLRFRPPERCPYSESPHRPRVCSWRTPWTRRTGRPRRNQPVLAAVAQPSM